MLNLLINSILLFVTTLVAVVIACRVFAYPISFARRVGAAAGFAGLYLITMPLPIPLVEIILPPVGLYVGLMDDDFDHDQVTRVFGLAFSLIVLVALVLFLVERL